MKSIFPLVTVVLVVLFLAGSGCQKSSDTDRGATSAAAAEYLLDAEPAAAQSVVDVRALLEEKKEPTDVVVVGRIGGLGQPTWDPEQAAFMIADLSLWHRKRRATRPSMTRRPSTMPRTARSVEQSRRKRLPDWR